MYFSDCNGATVRHPPVTDQLKSTKLIGSIMKSCRVSKVGSPRRISTKFGCSNRTEVAGEQSLLHEYDKEKSLR